MDFDHNYVEKSEKQGNNVACKNNEKSDTAANPTTTSSESNKINSSNTVEKSNLFKRRKLQLDLTNKDELKVVIERDNMIVGFVDAIDSDASEDDDEESDDERMPTRRRNLKRSRSKSPKALKKVRR